MIWGYAGLIELPWKLGEFSDARLYISQTRVYSPDAREWVSPDSYVKWNPQAAVTTPWDLHPFRYARNQPLDFVDPTGQFVPLLVIGGATAMGVGFGFGFNLAKNINSKNQISEAFKGAVVGGAVSAAMAALPAIGSAATVAVSTVDVVTLEALSAVGSSGAAGAKVVNYLASSPEKIQNAIDLISGTFQEVYNFSTPYSGNPIEFIPTIAIKTHNSLKELSNEKK